jgi:hypothetical protein
MGNCVWTTRDQIEFKKTKHLNTYIEEQAKNVQSMLREQDYLDARSQILTDWDLELVRRESILLKQAKTVRYRYKRSKNLELFILKHLHIVEFQKRQLENKDKEQQQQQQQPLKSFTTQKFKKSNHHGYSIIEKTAPLTDDTKGAPVAIEMFNINKIYKNKKTNATYQTLAPYPYIYNHEGHSFKTNEAQKPWIRLSKKLDLNYVLNKNLGDCTKVDLILDSTSLEYKTIERYYNDGWKDEKDGEEIYSIASITRVYDPATHSSYQNNKNKMIKMGICPNEMFLWHGTRASYEDIIKNGGLDVNRSLSSNRLGKGIYGSLHSAYSAKNFTIGCVRPNKENNENNENNDKEDDSNNENETKYKTLLLCQFALGNPEKHPDGHSCLNDFELNDTFHSRMFDRGDNRNFAVFKNEQQRICYVVQLQTPVNER